MLSRRFLDFIEHIDKETNRMYSENIYGGGSFMGGTILSQVCNVIQRHLREISIEDSTKFITLEAVVPNYNATSKVDYVSCYLNVIDKFSERSKDIIEDVLKTCMDVEYVSPLDGSVKLKIHLLFCYVYQRWVLGKCGTHTILEEQSECEKVAPSKKFNIIMNIHNNQKIDGFLTLIYSHTDEELRPLLELLISLYQRSL